MPLVTVKPKFQVTIPAKLRKGLGLREDDVVEASVVADGILLRPKEEVDRDAGTRWVGPRFSRASDLLRRMPDAARTTSWRTLLLISLPPARSVAATHERGHGLQPARIGSAR